MFDFIFDSGIEKNIFMLVFMLVFISGLSLFHTYIFSSILKNVKFKWSLCLIYNLIGAILFFIEPGFALAWIFFLAASLVVVVIVATIWGVLANTIKGIRKIISGKNRPPVYKTIISLLLLFLAVYTFYHTGSYFFIMLFAVVTIIFSLTGHHRGRYLKLQTILPTSKIRSMAMGLVELEGRAKAMETFAAPIRSRKCIGYRYTVEEEKQDQDGDTYYSIVRSELKCNRFILEDETGRVEVLSDDIEFIMFPIDEQYCSGSYRYTQYVLSEDDEVLLIGKATLDGDTPVIAREDVKKVFGIAPVYRVNNWNRFKPLRSTLYVHLIVFAFILGIILLLEIKEVDGSIVVSLPQNLFSWENFKIN